MCSDGVVCFVSLTCEWARAHQSVDSSGTVLLLVVRSLALANEVCLSVTVCYHDTVVVVIVWT